MVGPPFASRGVAALCFRRSRGPHVGDGHIFCMGAHSALYARKATTMSEDNNQVPNEVTQKLLFFIIALVLLVIVKYVLGL